MDDQHFLEFQRRTRAFECVTTFGEDHVTLTGMGDAVRLQTAMVTSSFFAVLRVNPAMGRSFTSQEEQPGSPGVAVLSEKLWRSRFAGDPNILRKAIIVDGVKRSVIGIMPAGFAFPDDAQLWLPLAIEPGPQNAYFRTAFGRLQPSVTLRQAEAELAALASQLVTSPGYRKDSMTTEILPLQDMLVGQIRKSLLIFMGAVAFVLLIACANGANLLLMKGIAAPPGDGSAHSAGSAAQPADSPVADRRARCYLSAAAIAGLLVAILEFARCSHSHLAGIIPRVAEVHLDGRVIGFALGLGAVTGILFGLLPAVQATGRELRTFLSQAGRAVTGRSESCVVFWLSLKLP